MRTYNHQQWIMLLALIIIPFSCTRQTTEYKINSKNLTIQLSKDGDIMRMWLGENEIEKKMHAYTEIAGCHLQGDVVSRRLNDGSIEFKKTLVNDSLQTSCFLTERFIPESTSIRWEVSITGKGKQWGSTIKNVFQYPVKQTSRFWAAWASPPLHGSVTDSSLLQSLHPYRRPGIPDMKQWVDPFIPIPFTKAMFYYGAPYLTNADPMLIYWPVRNDVISIPMCSILDDTEKTGFTIGLSPADDIMDLVLNTDKNGYISFSRIHHRIPKDKSITFSIELVAGENDWRDGLGWIAEHYPLYFSPVTKDALKFAGTGAYSDYTSRLKTAKLRKMAFTVNWKASFDFPYMGMFIPYVKPEDKWERFGKGTTSALKMDDYAATMEKDGFYVFNYFNVTEFGTDITSPSSGQPIKYAAEDMWKDASRFLYDSLSTAMLKVPEKMNTEKRPGTEPGGLYYSWRGSVVMDCGDTIYRNFLLEQAKRHIEEIPHSFGICIDRMDWLRMFNEHADDGISWYDGKPARSLITSWKQLMDTLGPLMHKHGKSILVNNHTKRIDLLKNVDGIFDEFTYSGASLNLTALLSVYKPALGWTDTVATIEMEGMDNFFQRYLYMGVYPMCPFPDNHHSIKPGAVADRFYLEYGPLLKAMKERKWILRPHVISVQDQVAKANIFSVPSGYAIPVVYAKDGIRKVRITLRHIAINKITSCVAYYPGKEEPIEIPFKKGSDYIMLDVPVEHRCAMVVAETTK